MPSRGSTRNLYSSTHAAGPTNAPSFARFGLNLLNWMHSLAGTRAMTAFTGRLRSLSGNRLDPVSDGGVWETPDERALARLPDDAPFGVHPVPSPDGSFLIAKLAGPDGALLLQMRADAFADALGPTALFPDARHRLIGPSFVGPGWQTRGGSGRAGDSVRAGS